MTEWVQDVTVTSIALLAAGVVLRRVAAFVQPVKGGSDGCSACGSRPQTCGAREPHGAAQTTVPVDVLRSPTRRHPTS